MCDFAQFVIHNKTWKVYPVYIIENLLIVIVYKKNNLCTLNLSRA